jgi:hypothetical protein
VLVGLPQGVGGLAILFYFTLFLQHAPGARTVPPRAGLVALLSHFISFYFIWVFYNTHQVLVELPQGVGGLAILF